MSRALMFSVVAGFVFSSVVLSQTPTPVKLSQHKQDVRSDEKPQPQTGAPVSSQTPSSINQPSREPTKQTGASASSKDSEKSTFDYNALAVTIFTAALAYLAWLQWRAMSKQGEYMREQAGYMRDGLIETKKAADAAKASADIATKSAENAEKSMLLMERAVLVSEDIETFPDGPLKLETRIDAQIKNYGRTHAHSVKISGTLIYAEHRSELGKFPPLILASDADHKISFEPLETWLTDGALQQIEEHLYILRIEIQISYFDVFDKPHGNKSKGEYIPNMRMFTPDRDHR